MNHFSKIPTFFLPEKSIFSRNIHPIIRKIEDLTKISEFFRNIGLNLSFFMIPYKFREGFGEFLFLVEKYIKKAQNSIDRAGVHIENSIRKCRKSRFCRKSLEFVGKCKNLKIS